MRESGIKAGKRPDRLSGMWWARRRGRLGERGLFMAETASDSSAEKVT